ncbi:hypothetical protein ES702_02766 [subsurface metagenome]
MLKKCLEQIKDSVTNCASNLKAWNKKAQTGLSGLQSAAIAFVVIGVTFGVGLQIQSDTASDFTANSAEKNASDDAIEGSSNIAGKLPLIGTVIAAVVVIGLIVRNLGRVGQ